MHPILIFRHVECEGPGYLADFLTRNKVPFRIVCIDEGEAVPGDLDGIAGLVFMGGPMSVNDPLDWIEDEIALIRAAHAREMPVLGHCLGGQLIARALGATVSPGPVREIGWLAVQQLNSAAGSPYLAGLAQEFEVFHWHGESFSLPEQATALLRSANCEQQAFSCGRTLALQCHIEMTTEQVKTWTQAFAGQLQQPSASVQTAAVMLDDVETKVARLHMIADTIYQHWLRGFNA